MSIGELSRQDNFESRTDFRFLGRPGKIILTSFKAPALNKNEEKLAKLYQTVPRATLIEVYKKYKYDYELFGFDFNNVLKLAGYHTLTKNEETMEPGFYKTDQTLFGSLKMTDIYDYKKS